ncbi:major capsid [Acinetobacter phage nACB1]|nr:major capsid [Acinetobacter phage nACB1]
MAHYYNEGGNTSTVGTQLQDFYYARDAITEVAKEQYFTQLASTTDMPKHYGQRIVRYIYVPLLDDRNKNDQGIDATGAVIADGNLYGSSKDIGKITDKMPVLSESGGRVNRVGFVRKTLEGTFQNYGYFTEYTEDSLNFDTDEQLMMHINREMLTGASQISEALIQADLLNNAGITKYAGTATAANEIDKTSIVDFQDLVNLTTDLDNNRTPKDTKINTGSVKIDTRTINAARLMYVGSELKNTLRKMKDFFDEKAFVGVQHYAAGTTPLRGEIGSIDEFRIIVVPEMMHWSAAGATSTANDGIHVTNGKANVYPMLVVGSESFTTIGFQSDAKSVKYKIIHKKPADNAGLHNPYGKIGFMSIQWWYGFMVIRPERIALIKTAALV